MAVTKAQIQQMVDEDLKVPEMADELGVGTQYIYRLLKRYGIEHSSRQLKYTAKRLNEIQRLFDAGFSQTEVASKLHMTISQMNWAVHKYHLTPPARKKCVPKLMQIRQQYFTECMTVSEIALVWGESEADMRKWMIDNHIINQSRNTDLSKRIRKPQFRDDFLDGMFRKCAVCGKSFAISDLREYAYKTIVPNGKSTKSLYFCTWSCMSAYKKEHANERKYNKRI